MATNQLIKDAAERLRPQYRHADRDFPVPMWHVVAEAVKLGWGFPYEFSTSPQGNEAAVSFDPDSGRTVSAADSTDAPSEIEAWFDHELDPFGANPEYYAANETALLDLARDAACYLANGDDL